MDNNGHFIPMEELPRFIINTLLSLRIFVIYDQFNFERRDISLSRRYMQCEFVRYITFFNFPPSPRDVRDYVTAGFYYSQDRDFVLCYCCGYCRGNWHSDEVPLDIHRQFSPNCIFVNANVTADIPFHLFPGRCERFFTYPRSEFNSQGLSQASTRTARDEERLPRVRGVRPVIFEQVEGHEHIPLANLPMTQGFQGVQIRRLGDSNFQESEMSGSPMMIMLQNPPSRVDFTNYTESSLSGLFSYQSGFRNSFLEEHIGTCGTTGPTVEQDEEHCYIENTVPEVQEAQRVQMNDSRENETDETERKDIYQPETNHKSEYVINGRKENISPKIIPAQYLTKLANDTSNLHRSDISELDSNNISGAAVVPSDEPYSDLDNENHIHDLSIGQTDQMEISVNPCKEESASSVMREPENVSTVYQDPRNIDSSTDPQIRAESPDIRTIDHGTEVPDASDSFQEQRDFSVNSGCGNSEGLTLSLTSEPSADDNIGGITFEPSYKDSVAKQASSHTDTDQSDQQPHPEPQVELEKSEKDDRTQSGTSLDNNTTGKIQHPATLNANAFNHMNQNKEDQTGGGQVVQDHPQPQAKLSEKLNTDYRRRTGTETSFGNNTTGKVQHPETCTADDSYQANQNKEEQACSHTDTDQSDKEPHQYEKDIRRQTGTAASLDNSTTGKNQYPATWNANDIPQTNQIKEDQTGSSKVVQDQPQLQAKLMVELETLEIENHGRTGAQTSLKNITTGKVQHPQTCTADGYDQTNQKKEEQANCRTDTDQSDQEPHSQHRAEQETCETDDPERTGTTASFETNTTRKPQHSSRFTANGSNQTNENKEEQASVHTDTDHSDQKPHPEPQAELEMSETDDCTQTGTTASLDNNTTGKIQHPATWNANDITETIQYKEEQACSHTDTDKSDPEAHHEFQAELEDNEKDIRRQMGTTASLDNNTTGKMQHPATCNANDSIQTNQIKEDQTGSSQVVQDQPQSQAKLATENHGRTRAQTSLENITTGKVQHPQTCTADGYDQTNQKKEEQASSHTDTDQSDQEPHSRHRAELEKYETDDLERTRTTASFETNTTRKTQHPSRFTANGCNQTNENNEEQASGLTDTDQSDKKPHLEPQAELEKSEAVDRTQRGTTASVDNNSTRKIKHPETLNAKAFYHMIQNKEDQTGDGQVKPTTELEKLETENRGRTGTETSFENNTSGKVQHPETCTAHGYDQTNENNKAEQMTETDMRNRDTDSIINLGDVTTENGHRRSPICQQKQNNTHTNQISPNNATKTDKRKLPIAQENGTKICKQTKSDKHSDVGEDISVSKNQNLLLDETLITGTDDKRSHVTQDTASEYNVHMRSQSEASFHNETGRAAEMKMGEHAARTTDIRQNDGIHENVIKEDRKIPLTSSSPIGITVGFTQKTEEKPKASLTSEESVKCQKHEFDNEELLFAKSLANEIKKIKDPKVRNHIKMRCWNAIREAQAPKGSDEKKENEERSSPPRTP